jgi:hypothetical protein
LNCLLDLASNLPEQVPHPGDHHTMWVTSTTDVSEQQGDLSVVDTRAMLS